MAKHWLIAVLMFNRPFFMQQISELFKNAHALSQYLLSGNNRGIYQNLISKFKIKEEYFW
jgi:hypothetical protein